MEKVNILFRSSPYGKVNDIEGLRLCTALTAMEIDTNAIFIEDGVYALVRDQRPEGIGLPSIESACKNLAKFNVKVYVLEEALRKRGIKQEDLIKTDLKLISKREMAKLISEGDVAFTV